MTFSSQRSDPGLQIGLVGVGRVLRDRLLTVPSFQRSYSWDLPQVETFLSDITAAMQSSDPTYFLGTMVLAPRPRGQSVVIDGQQRLATVTMLLAALRDELANSGDDDRAAVVSRTYLASLTLDGPALEPRLRLNTEDDAYFQARVVHGLAEHETARLTSHRRIDRAMERMTAFVRSERSLGQSELSDFAFRLVDFIEDRLLVIRVEVASEADAYQIFETLNDRGIELTVGDLLRNYVFSIAGDHLPEVEQGWIAALEALDLPLEDQVFLNFLRHYWSANRGPVRERQLYREFRRHIGTAEQAQGLVASLAAWAPNYAAIMSAGHDRWAELQVPRYLSDTLLRLGLEQQRPLLLAAMSAFGSAELVRLLHSLVHWSVRGLVAGGIGGGTTERYYADAAVAISRGEARTTEDVLSILLPIVPPDSVVESSFANMSVAKLSLAKYYLLSIERALSGRPRPELYSDSEALGVHVARVLPRIAETDAQAWGKFTPEEAKQWVPRLGNAVLVSGRPGTPHSPTAARALFAASEFETTRRVSERRQWSPAEIKRRQRELAAMASDVWSIEIPRT